MPQRAPAASSSALRRMRELFVYYRVRPGTQQAAQAAVVAMQRRLCVAHRGLEARLLKRIDAATGNETWMEIYASRADAEPAFAIDDAVEAAIVMGATALQQFIDGGRHVERFERVDPP